MTDAPSPRILLLPGWLNSGPEHWQSRWEALHGDTRVQQHDWEWPKRGDWMMQLEEALLASPQPAVLVAPPDVERADTPPQIAGWAPMVRQPLPFPAIALISSDDPFCAPERAERMAADWGATALEIGPLGHINGESGLGDWPEGRRVLESLSGEPEDDGD